MENKNVQNTTNTSAKAHELVKYKIAAGIGTVIMAVGSFMACLSLNRMTANVGNVLLLVSIGIMLYGFSKWQP
ncbi:MAG: hypothetical protein IJU30_08665 [Lachnospiraceae bacterium]|nr:hypothetical protein [Lachnospiraceae bacterium]